MAKARENRVRLVVAGESRVDLLPPEVTARARAKSTRRALGGVVVTALVVSAGGFAFASLLAASSESELVSEQTRSAMLVKEQGKFSEVTEVESQLALSREAAQVGASTEIDWASYVGAVQATLPAGIVITEIVSDTATPMQAYTQSDSPLQGTRIATLVFTARSTDLPQVEQWLVGLEQLAGFVDAIPGSIASEEGAGYAVTITMHIDSAAYSGRFVPTDETGENE